MDVGSYSQEDIRDWWVFAHEMSMKAPEGCILPMGSRHTHRRDAFGMEMHIPSV